MNRPSPSPSLPESTLVGTGVVGAEPAAPATHESDRRFRDLLCKVDLASVMLDREANITFCNDYLLRLTGWERAELIGRNYFELLLRLTPDATRPFIATLTADAPTTWQRDNVIFTRTGERRVMRWNNLMLRDAAGDVIGTASIGEDITERKQAEARIAYLNRIYVMLSRINALIVRARDREELFREACRIAVDKGGFALAMLRILDRGSMKLVPVALAGQDHDVVELVREVLAAGDVAVNAMIEQAMREKKAIVANDSQNDPRVQHREKHVQFGFRSMVILPLIVADEAVGVLALYDNEIESFHEEEMRHLLEVAGDIAFAINQIEKQDRLDYLAYYDSLTGLANRSLFLDRLAQYMRSSGDGGYQLAVLLIDVERFKSINDTLGRPAGDALLRQVAAWLTQFVDDVNLLSRIGADQFAVVLPDAMKVEAVARNVEQMIEAFLNHPFELNGAVFRVAAKVGVAMFPDDGVECDTLFKHAEAALKNAKQAGERYLFYTQRMTASVAGRLTLENQLRRALEREEFELHYQPKVNLASGQITGVEALIHWNDPSTGVVAPAHFIPVLEEIGLIYEVGSWALRKAMEDYLRWCRAGLAAVRIAVNVSPLQLRHRDFIPGIDRLIGAAPLAAAALEIEITEGTVMADAEYNTNMLRAIRALGVRVAIDDFGTGFSSLSYLAKLPLDTLKIHRTFVTDMDSGPSGLALVSTIINLAQALKLNVVADGVETEVQSHLLRLLGCNEMQGRQFSEPLPTALLEAQFLTPRPAAA